MTLEHTNGAGRFAKVRSALRTLTWRDAVSVILITLSCLSWRAARRAEDSADAAADVADQAKGAADQAASNVDDLEQRIRDHSSQIDELRIVR